MGCQNKYLTVPKSILRKLFFIEKTILFSNSEIEPKEILAVKSIISCGFDKAGFYLFGGTIWEKLSKKRRFFFNMFGQRTKKFRPPGYIFSQGCQNFVLRVHKNNLRKLSSEILENFQNLLAIEQKICWTKQGRGIAESCRKPLSPVKIYWRGPFDVSESLWIQKTKHKSGITLFF